MRMGQWERNEISAAAAEEEEERAHNILLRKTKQQNEKRKKKTNVYFGWCNKNCLSPRTKNQNGKKPKEDERAAKKEMQNNSLHSKLNGEDVLVRNLSFSFFFIFIIFDERLWRMVVMAGVPSKQTFVYVRRHTHAHA